MATKGGTSIPLYSHERFLSYHRLIDSFPSGCPSGVAKVRDTRGGDVRRTALRLGTINTKKNLGVICLTPQGKAIVEADRSGEQEELAMVLHGLWWEKIPQYRAVLEILVAGSQKRDELFRIAKILLQGEHQSLDKPSFSTVLSVGKKIGVISAMEDRRAAIVPQFSERIKLMYVQKIIHLIMYESEVDAIHTQTVVDNLTTRFAKAEMDLEETEILKLVMRAVGDKSCHLIFKMGVGTKHITPEYAMIMRTR